MPWYPPKKRTGFFSFIPERRTALSAAKVGEWGEAGRRIRELAHFVPDSRRIIQDAAAEAAEDLRNKINNGGFPEWEKITDRRQEIKDISGLGNIPLVAHGDYVDAIKVIPMGPNVWAFGINKSARNRDGDSLVMIGMSHEYGEGGNPPRPHWRPAYRDFTQKVIGELTLEAAKTVRGVK